MGLERPLVDPPRVLRGRRRRRRDSRGQDNNAALKEKLKAALRSAYAEKDGELGPDSMKDFEKFFMLQTVDALWKDHLLALDHLKEGIGLRGYGQRDPLVEYKKESFQLFEAMKEAIEEQILQNLFRFEVVRQEDADARSAPAEAAARRRRGGRRAVGRRLGPVALHPGLGRAREAGAEAASRADVPGDLGPHVRGRLPGRHREDRRAEGRPERPLPLRLRQEVQEVPRGVRGRLTVDFPPFSSRTGAALESAAPVVL